MVRGRRAARKPPPSQPQLRIQERARPRRPAQPHPDAHAKLRELDDLIARAERKHGIMAGMECGCVRWEDCVLAQPAP